MRSRFLMVSCLALLCAPVLVGPADAQTPRRSPCSPGGPAAQGYPPGDCGLAVSKNVLRRGESFTATGFGFAPSSTVPLEFRSAQVSLGSVQTDAAGSFATTLVVPADATLGSHVLAAIITNPAAERRELTAALTVVADTGTGSGTGLPRTGQASTIPASIAGAALIAVGTLVVLAARRKRAVA